MTTRLAGSAAEAYDESALRARRRDAAERVIAGARPRRDLLDSLGTQAACRVLGLPESALALLQGERHRRRRLCALLAARLGGSAKAIAARAEALPAEPEILAGAAYLYAVTLAVADAPRVLPRARYAALAEAYGDAALAFALEARGRLGGAPDAGDGRLAVEALAARAPAGLVAALAGDGDLAAGIVAARLGLRVETPAPDAHAPARAALARAAIVRAATVAAAMVEARQEEAREDAPDPGAEATLPEASAGP